MKNNIFYFILFLLFSTNSFGQQFQIGNRVNPKSKQFKLLDYSPSMKVHTYQYVGKIKDKYLFDRRVGEILIGLKKGKQSCW